MEVPSYFGDFMKGIRLTDNQVSDAKTGHETLRKRLRDDEGLSSVLVATFLQGSYRRATAVRPKGDSQAAREQFQEFGAKQPRWQSEPLLIPDRKVGKWEETHPLEQIRWTVGKNGRCDGHYVNVVKAVKWWRLVQHPEDKHPKGYPLEHIVGDCCPDGISSVAEGFTSTLEAVSSKYAHYVDRDEVPYLPDRGVPEHNVLKRTTSEEFAALHEQASEAAEVARKALDEEDLSKSVELWRELFGDKFPAPPPEDEGAPTKGAAGAYGQRQQPSDPRGARYA